MSDGNQNGSQVFTGILLSVIVCALLSFAETVRAAEPTPTITPPPPMASEYADRDETLTEEDEENLGFFASFWNGLVHLIIPRNEFFSSEFDKLDERLKEKLPYVTYVTTIGRLKDATSFYDGEDGEDGEDDNPAGENDVNFDFTEKSVSGVVSNMAKFISSTGKPFFDYFRPVIYGLYIFFLVFYNYRQLMFLIRGVNYSNINAGAPEMNELTTAYNRSASAGGKF